MIHQHDYLVFVGRFQPLHNGHVHVINRALALAAKVIILVGSANVARSPRNPFTYQERCAMIGDAVASGEIEASADRIILRPIADFTYNDAAWIARVQRCVDEAVLADANPSRDVTLHGIRDFRIGLIGHGKDGSSYYLRMFPDWTAVDVQAQHGTLNATDLRQDFFRRAPRFPSEHLCPKATIAFLGKFMLTGAFKWLLAEATHYENYKAAWGKTPYPVFVNCVDAVVIQSGHILLVERGKHPGQGLLALPGGHVEVDEGFRDAAIRELKEETRIADGRGEIPPAMLASFIADSKTRLIDDPHRSERGRVVTQAFLFALPNRPALFAVRGDDDAASARWHELGRLHAGRFFEDHAAIIREMTGALID